MLLPHITINEEFKNLILEVRNQRASMKICPSAYEGIIINQLLKDIITKEIYKDDYTTITTYFQNKPVAYNEAVKTLEKIKIYVIFWAVPAPMSFFEPVSAIPFWGFALSSFELTPFTSLSPVLCHFSSPQNSLIK